MKLISHQQIFVTDGLPEKDGGFSFVIEFFDSFELNPRVLLESAFQVSLHALHLLSEVNLSLNSKQK